MRNRTFYDADGIVLRDSVACDVLALKDRLRAADVDELWASSRIGPDQALRDSMAASVECMTIAIDGNPIAMFGIAPLELMGRTASIWMLGTDELLSVQFRFLRHNKRIIRMFLESYPVLYNWVDARNTVSIKWLEWLGAKIYPAAPYGPDGLPFHLFTISREE